jgi:hypothetical protein
MTRAPILFLFTVMLSVFPLRGASITVSYTEYFDYSIGGIVGHPSAIWSATFDASLTPSNPFPSTPSSVNMDFILSGLSTNHAPSLIWQGGNISGAGPANFTLQGTSYLVFPFLPLFPSCSLPCSAVATHPNQATNIALPDTSFFASSPDNYVAVAAVTPPLPGVPEPGTLLLIVCGLGGLGLLAPKLRTT